VWLWAPAAAYIHLLAARLNCKSSSDTGAYIRSSPSETYKLSLGLSLFGLSLSAASSHSLRHLPVESRRTVAIDLRFRTHPWRHPDDERHVWRINVNRIVVLTMSQFFESEGAGLRSTRVRALESNSDKPTTGHGCVSIFYKCTSF
jgi:hypothetical protein